MKTITLSFTILAVLLWGYILKNGGLEKLRRNDTAVSLTSGDPMNGYKLIVANGCGACHSIPGIPAASGKIGPDLKTFKDRAMIAGVLKNNGENLTLWLLNPRTVDPKTAMPILGLTREQARDIAAYLYSMK